MTPQIFISHASSNSKLVKHIRDKLNSVFANGVKVFASSIPGSIPPGSDWFASIRENLTKSSVLLFLITPQSIDRPWVWFEMGASWEKHTEGKLRAIPLCCGVSLRDLPPPLSAIQGIDLSSQAHVEQLFHELMTFFNFGDEKRIQAKKFVEKLNEAGGCNDSTSSSTALSPADFALMLEILISNKYLSENGLDVIAGYNVLPSRQITILRSLFYKK